MSRVRHLFFTHGHADHFAVEELQYTSWMFVPHPVARPLHVVAPEEILCRIRTELDMAILPLDLQPIAPWAPMNVEHWTVTAVEAQHEASLQCFNYLIADGETSMLYATDTGWWREPTWEYLAGAQLGAVVIECTKGLDEGGYKAHLSVPEVIRLRDRLDRGGALRAGAVVVTTHHSHLSGLLHDELAALLEPHGILAGYDGLVFTI